MRREDRFQDTTMTPLGKAVSNCKALAHYAGRTAGIIHQREAAGDIVKSTVNDAKQCIRELLTIASTSRLSKFFPSTVVNFLQEEKAVSAF